ncbi:CGL lyase, partial [Acromyrmex charruanus]
MMFTEKSFATIAIHAGQDPDQWNHRSVVPPLVMSATFKQNCPALPKHFSYGRIGNPTRNVLETCLTALEKGKYAFCFSSGLGTLTAIIGLLEMIRLETPTNPLMKLTDIKAIAESLKSPDIIIVVDNTFLTCYFQKPLDLGADLAMYSLTKYMNGHTDSWELFHHHLTVPWLKTLELKMQKHMKNGLAVATHMFLDSHPNVEKVIHPLLSSHPQHQLALTQQTGHSGMVSFYLKGDSKRFLIALKIFVLAVSLGGYESLAELPSVMTHLSVPEDVRIKLGVTDQLIRLSVGFETEDDLIADLKQALNAC